MKKKRKLTQTELLEKLKAPKILMENTYYWYPGVSAASRRINERKRITLVRGWAIKLAERLKRRGYETKLIADVDSVELFANNELVMRFSYSESCKHVYKHQKISKKWLEIAYQRRNKHGKV